jgi:hypothetical protein
VSGCHGRGGKKTEGGVVRWGLLPGGDVRSAVPKAARESRELKIKRGAGPAFSHSHANAPFTPPSTALPSPPVRSD